MSERTDPSLIDRCRRKDEAAWNEVFDRHYEPVVRFVFQQSDAFTREDAEELAQETFVTAIRNIRTFREACTFQTWLFRIAMNKGRDLIEKRNAAKRGGGRTPVSLNSPGPDGALPPLPPSEAAPPDEAAARNDDFARLRVALDRLAGACRDLIELRYFGDVTLDELAEECGLPAKTVSIRLTKCLQRLRELVEEKRRAAP